MRKRLAYAHEDRIYARDLDMHTKITCVYGNRAFIMYPWAVGSPYGTGITGITLCERIRPSERRSSQPPA
ncbi:MAG: hypothetical protein GX795_07365 [Firmicutes bacterium]|nr:hypothetical protein [Bacillota bacterium]